MGLAVPGSDPAALASSPTFICAVRLAFGILARVQLASVQVVGVRSSPDAATVRSSPVLAPQDEGACVVEDDGDQVPSSSRRRLLTLQPQADGGRRLDAPPLWVVDTSIDVSQTALPLTSSASAEAAVAAVRAEVQGAFSNASQLDALFGPVLSSACASLAQPQSCPSSPSQILGVTTSAGAAGASSSPSSYSALWAQVSSSSTLPAVVGVLAAVFVAGGLVGLVFGATRACRARSKVGAEPVVAAAAAAAAAPSSTRVLLAPSSSVSYTYTTTTDHPLVHPLVTAFDGRGDADVSRSAVAWGPGGSGGGTVQHGGWTAGAGALHEARPGGLREEAPMAARSAGASPSRPFHQQQQVLQQVMHHREQTHVPGAVVEGEGEWREGRHRHVSPTAPPPSA